jgi:hypothetical protein
VRRGGDGTPFYRVGGGAAIGRVGELSGQWWDAIMGHPVRWGGETEGSVGCEEEGSAVPFP